jgi:hypothetical protein
MNGNVFISVPQAGIYNELPASITSYDWVETVYDAENPEAEPTTVNHHPTWDRLGERNKAAYGEVIVVTVGEDVFHVYELTASWKEGEVSALLALGAGLAAPSYTLMTAAEAKAFISANAPTLE